MPLIAIYNPVCGDSDTEQFFKDSVFPLLESSGKKVDKVVATESAGHAATILLDFLESNEGDISLILGSGDGTLHEIINGLASAEVKGARQQGPPRLQLALVPCGTANALYSSLFPPKDTPAKDPDYRLQSVRSMLSGENLKPLTLAITTISSPPSFKKTPKAIVGAVVVSTGLHASILYDSEALRKEMPGVERFKVAAQKNSTSWVSGTLKIFPSHSADYVELYNPATGAFVQHPDSDEDEAIVEMSGPFAYLLATVNVDRLEPTFQITPLQSKIPPVQGTCELILIRPEWDPSFSVDNEEERSKFTPKLWKALQAAYRDGELVNLRYDDKGEVVTDGEGPVLVEYFRCGGFEWYPDGIDDRAHLICIDGSIARIDEGGRAFCSAVTPDNATSGFMVYI